MKRWILNSIFCLISIFGISQRLTPETLWLEILKDSIKCPEIVWTQGIWESGWLTSNIFITRHNIFAFNSSKGYVYFKSDEESVLAYKSWQDRNYDGKKDYYQFLIDIHYAGDPYYVEHLKSIKLPKYIKYD